MAKKRKGGLGRGLDSLISESRGEVGLDDSSAEQPSRIAANPESDALEDEREAARAQEAPVTERQPRHAAPDSTVPSETRRADWEPGANTANDRIAIRGVVDREVAGKEEIPLAAIVPNPDQPRTHFKEEEIDELAQSIEKDGLLQPILVRQAGDTYQIIAGERRWQACKKLGLASVPVRVIEADDDKAVELALIENIQRSDLNPIEEAYGYKRLMERRGMTQGDVAKAVSKGRSTIANALRLLDLPEEAQQLLYEEKITAGHARAILSIPQRSGREQLTQKLREGNLSVREAEALARLIAGSAKARTAVTKAPAPAYFKKAARSLSEQLEAPVKVKSSKGKNRIEIEFTDEEDLKRIFELVVPPTS